MTTQRTDSLLDADALLRFLQTRGIEIRRPLWDIKLIHASMSMLTFRVRSASHDLVVRRPALGHHTLSGQDVLREFRLTTTLRAAGLPVPPPVAASIDETILGAPFIVLAYVDGITLRTADDLYGLPPQCLLTASSRLVENLAAMHSIDVAAVGLSDLRRPKHDAACEVEHWLHQWELVGRHDEPLVSEVGRRLLELAPARSRATVVHGDYWIGNVVLDRLTCSRIQAVIGWDCGGIGDPSSDVAMLCAYQHPAVNALLGVRAASTSPRMPSNLLEMYAAAADTQPSHWPFHLGLAYFKLAVRAQQMATRFYDFEGSGRARPGEAVSILLEAAQQCAANVSDS